MHVLRSVAAHNDKFSTKSVSEIMVRNFSKVKEDFFIIYQITKTSFILCTGDTMWEIYSDIWSLH